MNQRIETELARFANSMIGMPFRWGVCDCNTFGVECLDLICGTQLSFEVVGQYSSASTAKSFYRDFRLDWLAWSRFTRIDRNYLQTGDYIVAVEDDWCVPYVVVGSNVVTSTVERGVVSCRLDLVFRVHDIYHCFRPAIKDGL